ncbi:hypothetical protein GCM10023142_00260 [Anaerocolumna aminovalerica]
MSNIKRIDKEQVITEKIKDVFWLKNIKFITKYNKKPDNTPVIIFTYPLYPAYLHILT